MVNLLLTNNNLKSFIDSADISQEQKDSLLSKIPQLDESERIKLLDVLRDIYTLDLKRKEAAEKIKKNWLE